MVTGITETEEMLNGNTVSVEEAAEIMHISRSVAYESVKNGKLPSLKFGARRIRIPVAALKKMLETGVQPGPGETGSRRPQQQGLRK